MRVFGQIRSLMRRSPLARKLYCQSFLLRYLRYRALPGHRSFAQAGEDLALQRRLGKVSFFLDIGAHDGISGSNTFYFSLRGARGICFEPVRGTFNKLASLYRLNSRVLCLNCGISDVTRSAEILAADFLSYLPETEDCWHTDVNKGGFLAPPQEEVVQLLSFEDAVRGRSLPSPVDLVSIDVEGHELNVLRSIDFRRYRFRALVVETHLRDGADYKWRHRDLAAIHSLLAEAGYKAVEETPANTIYLAAEAP